MSDDQTQVPAPPAPPTSPDSSETVTLKTPPSLLQDNAETTETPAEAPEEVPPAPSAPEAPEPATDPAEGSAEETPSKPVVNTTAGGQTVTFPDGRVVHTRFTDAPMSNTEWQQYERTHQGDQPRYPYVPGDREYTPYSDPNVPNSQLAQRVEREIASFAERVLENAEAAVSPIWNALHGLHESELDTAIASGGGSDKVMA
jgi:hypothetical protein